MKKILLLSNAGTYVFFNALNKSVPFLLLPLLTRHLSTVEYGIYASLQAILAFIAPAIGVSTGGAVARAYWDLSRDKMAVYIGSVFRLVGASALILSALALIFKTTIERIWHVPGGWISLVVILATANFVIAINLALWQMERRAFPYGLFQTAQSLLTYSLSIVFVVGLAWAWKGQILAQILVASGFASLSLFILNRRQYLSMEYSRQFALDALKFGLPIIPHEWGAVIINMSGLLFINALLGVSAVGSYSVGFTFAQGIGLLNHSFNQAWIPFLFEKLKKGGGSEKLKIVRLTYAYFVIIFLLALAVGYLAPAALKLLVGKDFQGSSLYVRVLTLGFAFNGMYLMISGYIFYSKKTHILAWVTFSSAVLNVIFNLILIPRNGPLGAAQAFLAAALMSFLASWWLSQRVFKMPWRQGLASILKRPQVQR